VCWVGLGEHQVNGVMKCVEKCVQLSSITGLVAITLPHKDKIYNNDIKRMA